MPGTFPTLPRPSSVSPPAIIDPTLRYSVDQGYEYRRAIHSRPRRRWTLEWLGSTVTDMRVVKDFIMLQRLGAMDFAFWHPTAFETATVAPTTPISIFYVHGLVTGQWLIISSMPTNPSLEGQAFPIQRFTSTSLTLQGTTGAGVAGNCVVQVYAPHCKAVFNEDTWEQPATIIGPDQVGGPGLRQGYYNYQLQIEELF